jgi:hypothetical protein
VSAVAITHQYSDGTVIEVAVEVDDDYPQSLAEAEARCLSLYRSVVPDLEVE